MQARRAVRFSVLGNMDLFSMIDAPWRTAFSLAWESWCAGSLGIGAVLIDDGGQVVAQGRNRVLEAPGSGNIAGTLVAHAEMDAFAGLRLGTAEGLKLYSTVEPCLMCAATAICMRTSRVFYAAADPVFEGLDDVLATHSYMSGRMPMREQLDAPILNQFAAVLPLAQRVWARPGQPPRAEWIDSHEELWLAATRLVEDGALTRLQNEAAGIDEVVAAVSHVLARP